MRFVNHYRTDRYRKDILHTKGMLHPDTSISITPDCLKNIEDNGKISFSFLGHSSVFINMSGFNILVDPVFSDRVGPYNIGPKRFMGPVAKPDDLPVIDAVLITHNHYDHFDIQTIKSIVCKTKHFIVPAGLGNLLNRCQIAAEKITELSWYEKIRLGEITITSMPAHHNSVRNLFDLNRTLWCSYVIQDKTHSIFHSGDTAFTEHFKNITDRFPFFDIVFMECGQYGSSWHNMHMFPEESVEAARLLNANISVPIHWGAYALSYHSYNEPIRRFENCAKEKKINYLLPVINRLYTC